MKLAWRNVYERVNGRLVQIDVLPRRDLKRHRRGPRCWCQPSCEQAEGEAPMYGHHAADGRELVEQHGVM